MNQSIPVSVTREQDRDLYAAVNVARAILKGAAESLAELRQLAIDIKAGNSETPANITLAYRHVEDASMRLGKTLQSLDGGVSVYDKATTPAIMPSLPPFAERGVEPGSMRRPTHGGRPDGGA